MTGAGLLLAVAGPDGRWVPGFGDPNPAGWTAAVGYVVVAVLALVAARSSMSASRALATRDPQAAADERLLARTLPLLFLVLLALGVNKQLDLQTLLTQTLRDMAKEQGWYERRHDLQVHTVKVALVGTALLGSGALLALRRVLRRIALAATGFALIVAYAAGRAAYFHHVHVRLGTDRHSWMAEIAGIALLGAGLVSMKRGSDRARAA